MYKHMGEVVIKILQGNAITQTTLGGLTTHSRVANFLQCICAKNYENWLTVDRVIAKNIWLTFFGPPCRPTNTEIMCDTQTRKIIAQKTMETV